MTNATNTEEKKTRNTRTKKYIVQKLDDSHDDSHWVQASGELKDFTDCDRWINANGEDGGVYRYAIITDPVIVQTETEVKRKTLPFE